MEKIWTKTTCCNDITDCRICPIMTKDICKHIKKNKPILYNPKKIKRDLIIIKYILPPYFPDKQRDNAC